MTKVRSEATIAKDKERKRLAYQKKRANITAEEKNTTNLKRTLNYAVEKRNAEERDRINQLRRANYAEEKDTINQTRRLNYAAEKELKSEASIAEDKERKQLAYQNKLVKTTAEDIITTNQIRRLNYAEDKDTINQIRRNQRFLKIQQEWDTDNPCQYCGCLHLKSVLKSQTARAICCMNGYVISEEENYFPILNPLPPELRDIAINRTTHFHRASTYYNNILCIGASGIDNGRGGKMEQINGPHAVKMNGRCYSYIPNTNNAGGINYFTFDGYLALRQHTDAINSKNPEHETVIQNILLRLFDELKEINPYAQDLMLVGKALAQCSYGTVNLSLPELKAKLNVQTHYLEVAGIRSDESSGNIVINYKLKGIQRSALSTSKEIEPICYPLLFPYGEFGWSKSLSTVIPYMRYLACRILMPERDLGIMPNGRLTNRFQLMSRLKQYYIVESLSRALDYRLQFHRKNRGYIFGQYDNYVNQDLDEVEDMNLNCDEHLDPDREQTNNSSESFLAESFSGSPRHLKSLARNAITIVSDRGKPTFFITLTFDQLWPEVQSELLQGQTAYDREDIVCRVFHARLHAFLHNLRAGKYFGGSRTEYVIYVIEYQHRGFPHAHIVCKMSGNIPLFGDKVACAKFIDNYISSEIIEIDNFKDIYSNNPDTYVLYKNLVTNKMMHTCSSQVNGCLNKEGECKRGYKNTDIIPHTTIDKKGFPVYRRRNECDLLVVPHNINILMDWGAHANVEYCGSSYTVLYLYKYLFKGNKKVKVSFDNTDDIDAKDEINLYIRGRIICAMDAMWRILGYQTYPATQPTVRIIKVKLPEAVNLLKDDNKTCDMEVYFKRHQSLTEMKYTEFFDNYTYTTKSDKEELEIFNLDIVIFYCFELNIGGRKIYVNKRSNPRSCITRMSTVPHSAGEIWFLRRLLLSYPARSYIDLKTVDNIIYNTFQEAAIVNGIVSDLTEGSIAFEENIPFSTPMELRSLLVILTIQGFATLHIYSNEVFKFKMLEDFLIENCNNNLAMANNMLLEDLEKRFKCEDKVLTDYGFPEPLNSKNEIEYEKLKYDSSKELHKLNSLCIDSPNTTEMEMLFKKICSAIIAQTTLLVFIQGIGGSGKSTFAKKLMAFTRSQGKIAKGCASTALAASIYEDFTTAHSLFCIPVIEDEEDLDQETEIVSNLINKEDHFDLMKQTSLFVWDEFLSNHKHCFGAAYNALEKFEGKVVVCMGDYRQIAPVVKNGSPAEVISASMISSKYWNLFEVFKFTKNLRLKGLEEIIDDTDVVAKMKFEEQYAYSKMILSIGDGISDSIDVQCVNENEKEFKTLIRLPLIKTITNRDEAIKFIYPNGYDTNTIYNRAILATTNEEVDAWNNKIQELNPEVKRTLLSSDSFNEVDDPHGYINDMITEEVMNAYKSSSSPPHILELKVNDICIVLRTLNKMNGLANGTRVRILKINKFTIRVETLGFNSQSFNIPRIRFKLRMPYGASFVMTRTQFPLRLAYCMTYNKSQGQEFESVLVDVRNEPFSHGQLYVASSRIRYANSIAFFCNENQIEDSAVIVTNVVYPKLII